jgi:hypothetical protein
MSAALSAIAVSVGLLTVVAPMPAAQAVTGTTVFNADFGSNAGRNNVSTSTGSPIVTTPQSHKIYLLGSTQPAGQQPYVEGPDYLQTNDNNHWSDIEADGSNVVFEVDEQSTTAQYNIMPFASNFEFGGVFSLSTRAGEFDSTNVYQKGYASGNDQYKLQTTAQNANGDAFAECRFEGSNVAGSQVWTPLAANASGTPVKVNDNTFHDIRCYKEATRVGIQIDSFPIQWTPSGSAYTVGSIVDNNVQPMRIFNRDQGTSTDACGYCKVRSVYVAVTTPTKNQCFGCAPAADLPGATKVLNTAAENLQASDRGVPTSVTGERVYEDATSFQADLYSYIESPNTISWINATVGPFLPANVGDPTWYHISANPVALKFNSYGLLKTEANLSPLSAGTRAFAYTVEAKLAQTSTNTQVIFAKGPSTGPGVRLRVPAGTTTPECVFRDSGGTQVVVPAVGYNMGTTDFSQLTCYRDTGSAATGKDDYGIRVNGTVQPSYAKYNSVTPLGSIPTVADPLYIGNDVNQTNGGGNPCISCAFWNIEVQIDGPAKNEAPWVGAGTGGSNGTWTNQGKYNFNGTYNATAKTVANSGSGTAGVMTLVNHPNWADTSSGTKNTVTFGAGGGTGSAGWIASAAGHNPQSADYRVSAVFRWDMTKNQGSTNVPIFKKNTAVGLTLNLDGRLTCSFGTTSVRSNIFVRDSTFHTVQCVRWNTNKISIVIDGVATTSAQTPGALSNTSNFLVAHNNASAPTAADTALVQVDQLDIYKGWAA